MTKTGGKTPAGLKPMQLGVNLSDFPYFNGNRAFANLLAGGSWSLINTQGQLGDMPGNYLDANFNVVRLGAGEAVARPFNVPTKALRGASVDVVCKWDGKATVQMWGGVVKNVRMGGQSLTFTFVPQGMTNGMFMFRDLDQSNPIRNVDCREADADPKAMFDATYLEGIKHYSTIRFMKWAYSVEANTKVTWANRTKPGDGRIAGPDSVPIEYMVMLANQTKTNPWFAVPWNADDDYIRKMATYVRDNLDPSLTAYVETSNEVWNWVYPVTKQASDEGVAEGLSDEIGHAAFYRYAERTGQVMDIWTSVYQGQMSRLVRVAATQNWPYVVGLVLGFRDTAKKIDAVATAPYFGVNLDPGSLTTASAMDSLFSGSLPGAIDVPLGEAVKVKALAAQYGLRYLAYESGQHILSPNDLDQMIKVQRDPRMGKMYTRYLTKWQNEIGDLMVLFADYGVISPYGAWGNQEYPGQTLADAPKANAIDLFRRSYLTR